MKIIRFKNYNKVKETLKGQIVFYLIHKMYFKINHKNKKNKVIKDIVK